SLSGFSEANGVYTVKVKGSAPGTLSLNAASAFGLTAQTVTLAATQAQLAASVSAADSTLTISPASIAADGTASATLSFAAKDAQQQPVAGLTVTFPATGVAGTTVSSVTESNGVYTATLHGTAAGVAHVT
ncbi:TPA: hypothetical protein I3803_004850, partial [Enterobacter cloacae]|nr:hypothetical protein [Enterobacter cloacae]